MTQTWDEFTADLHAEVRGRIPAWREIHRADLTALRRAAYDFGWNFGWHAWANAGDAEIAGDEAAEYLADAMIDEFEPIARATPGDEQG
jgi:hypothetical protein